MIIRKFTAVFFISLASILMLAFAVMPHHHHQEYICFNVAHCENEHSETQHSHDENPLTANHSCFSHLFQTDFSRTQSLIHACDEGHCFHFTQMLFITSDILTRLSQEAKCKDAFPTAYREKLHSSCYISDLSGRAPPYKG